MYCMKSHPQPKQVQAHFIRIEFNPGVTCIHPCRSMDRNQHKTHTHTDHHIHVQNSQIADGGRGPHIAGLERNVGQKTQHTNGNWIESHVGGGIYLGGIGEEGIKNTKLVRRLLKKSMTTTQKNILQFL